jgi:hypothetical protein
MRIITPQAHGMFDLYVVAMFFMAPILWGMTGEPRMILWSLCLVHLIVVCSSKFSYGIVKAIPMPVHGFLELVVGIFLLAAPYLFGFSDLNNERHFFNGAAFGLLVFWFLTDYSYPGDAWTKGAEIGEHTHDHDHEHGDHGHHHHNGHSHSHSH